MYNEEEKRLINQIEHVKKLNLLLSVNINHLINIISMWCIMMVIVTAPIFLAMIYLKI